MDAWGEAQTYVCTCMHVCVHTCVCPSKRARERPGHPEWSMPQWGAVEEMQLEMGDALFSF